MTQRSFSLCLCVCAFVLSFATACAKASAPYELRIENASGARLRTFPYQRQVFALGEMGERYNLRVVNHSGERVEAVVTVDGRDVLTGKPGDFRSERGYIVEPYGEVLIEGFRQSLSEVASFRFTSPGDSYSSRMGSPENVGIIGLAVFSEAHPARVTVAPPPPYDYSRDSYNDDRDYGRASGAPSSPSASAESAQGMGSARGSAADKAGEARSEAPAAAPARRERKSNIGTEYGEARYSAVRETEFERARPNRPTFVTTLRYDDRNGLIARGIAVDPPRARPQPAPPSAFPLSRFAPPPPETEWR